MTDKPKLAIFDFDGTIAKGGIVAPSVITGIKHLHESGCITTLSTGRGYVSIKGILGDIFDDVISPDAILILEHGTKLVDRQGNTIFGEFLSADEIEHIVDFFRANAGLFNFAWFNPVDVTRKIQFWCADESDVADQEARRGSSAHVFSSSIGKLRELLLEEQLTHVSFRLKDFIKVENLKLIFTRTDTNVLFQDGNMEFMRSNINKGLSVLEVARRLGIEKQDILLAGNAINDVEMIDLDVGTPILVGPKEARDTITPYLSDLSIITMIDSPAALGDYLCSL